MPEIFLLVVVATCELFVKVWEVDLADGVLIAIGIVVTGHLRLDTKGVAVLGKLQSSSGSPFGVPFHPKYLKYAHQTVSQPIPGTNTSRLTRYLQFPTAAVIAVM